MFEESILWSLFAELVYYTLYPLIRVVARRSGWFNLTCASFAPALIVILTNPTAGNYPAYGIELNWLLGLPCWLLGCVVAENMNTVRSMSVSARSIRLWRISVWGLSVVASVLRFHSPVGYPWTLGLFAVIVSLWLMREITWSVRHRPNAVLEWGGAWSYSIYLMHFPTLILLDSYTPLLETGSLATWMIHMFVILIVCYLFYLLVEKPGHGLARWAANRNKATKGVSSQG